MKLQPPLQIQQNRAQEEAQEVFRTQNIQKAAEQARKDLAKATADFSSSMALFKEKRALEEQEHSKRMDEMKREVKELEEKKRLALIPIEVYRKQADELVLRAKKFLEEVKQKEHNVDLIRDLLENRLDEVGHREQDVRDRETRLVSLERGAKIQQEQVKEGVKRLNESMQQFLAERDTANKDLDKRKTDIILMEQSVFAKHESNKRTEKALERWAILIKDREQTLLREEKRRAAK